MSEIKIVTTIVLIPDHGNEVEIATSTETVDNATVVQALRNLTSQASRGGGFPLPPPPSPPPPPA